MGNSMYTSHKSRMGARSTCHCTVGNCDCLAITVAVVKSIQLIHARIKHLLKGGMVKNGAKFAKVCTAAFINLTLGADHAVMEVVNRAAVK